VFAIYGSNRIYTIIFILLILFIPVNFLYLFSSPLRLPLMRYVELVQYSIAQMVHEVVDSFWAMIKTGTRRQDVRAGVRQPEHIFEMDSVIWGLSRHEDELSPFFKTHIGRSVDQICPGARSDRT
jgi:hypothetical protein